METHLLIEPAAAEAYDLARRQAEAAKIPDQSDADSPEADGQAEGSTSSAGTGESPKPKLPVRYFGVVELPAESAALRFSEISSEVIGHFPAEWGTRVRIRVDIEAINESGFDQQIVRTV